MTGYTGAMIEKNLDFNAFVWRCARAFGPLIHMRDEPMDADIPDTVPEEQDGSTYYKERHEEAEKALNAWEDLPLAARHKEITRVLRERLDGHRRYVNKVVAENLILTNMISQVEAWKAPEPHAPLKDFMLDQLRVSLVDVKRLFEESARYEAELSAPLDAAVDEHVAGLAGNVVYYRELAEKEKRSKNSVSANEWLAGLRASVGPPPRKGKS